MGALTLLIFRTPYIKKPAPGFFSPGAGFFNKLFQFLQAAMPCKVVII